MKTLLIIFLGAVLSGCAGATLVCSEGYKYSIEHDKVRGRSMAYPYGYFDHAGKFNHIKCH